MRAFHPEDKARSAIDTRLGACGWLVQRGTGMNVRGDRRRRARIRRPLPARWTTLCSWIAGSAASSRPSQRERRLAGSPNRPRVTSPSARIPWRRRGPASGSNMSRPTPKPCSATSPTLRRVRGASSPFTVPRRCAVADRAGHVARRGFGTCRRSSPRACVSLPDRGDRRQSKIAGPDDPRALVQMTMGAGKTFTACTASYRLLAHAGMQARPVSGRSRAISAIRPRPNMPPIGRPAPAGCSPNSTTSRSSGRPGSIKVRADGHRDDPTGLFGADRQGTRRGRRRRFRIRARR